MEKGMITTLAGIVSIVACVALVKKIKADIEELKKDRPTERFKMTDEQLEDLRNAVRVEWAERAYNPRKSFDTNGRTSEIGDRILAEQEEIRYMIEKIKRLK